jgi:preprotein translocase subunit YajC
LKEGKFGPIKLMFLFVFLSFLFPIIKFSNEIVLKQQFYNQLQDVIDKLNKNDKVNITGELNARIVTEKNGRFPWTTWRSGSK